MSKSWLLLDCDNLCHAVHHSPAGKLDNGVIYGFLRSVRALLRDFSPSQPVFCFDSKSSLRINSFPEYKITRRIAKEKELSEEETETLISFYQQRSALRKLHLPALGYNNVFQQKGYEADDLLAAIVEQIPKTEDIILVSSDKDLYQCLSKRVMMWKPIPKKIYGEGDFRRDYQDLDPCQWPSVKAIAGCGTDDVPGVEGVGDILAAKFLRDKLKDTVKVKQKILNWIDSGNYHKSLELVKLPYPGLPQFDLQEDEVTDKKWRQLAEQLGMRALFGKMPELGFGLFDRL